MLSLFILPSGSKTANSEKTFKSLQGLVKRVKFVSSIDAINLYQKQTDWYGVFYDNEWVDADLKIGIEMVFQMAKVDFFVLCKRHIKIDMLSTFTKCPRLFRKHVLLQENTLLPKQLGLRAGLIADGLVMSYDK
jgi:hypothetical protein